MVQIAIGWGCEFQGTETDVIKGLIVDAESLVGVFHKLVNGEGGIIGFYDGVTDLKNKLSEFSRIFFPNYAFSRNFFVVHVDTKYKRGLQKSWHYLQIMRAFFLS